MLVTVITCVGLVLTVLSAVSALRFARTGGTRIPANAIAWGVVFALLQAFIAIWSGIGLVESDLLSALVLNVVLTGCAWVSFNRARVSERALALVGPEGRLPHPLVASVLLLLVAGFFAVLGLEVPSNHDITWMYPLCLLLEWALVTAVMAGAFLIFQRRGGISAGIALVLHVIGIAEYFVVLFKSMPITPGDLTALSTAAAVAGTGYSYTLSAFCLYGMACAAVSMTLLQVAGILRPERSRRTRRGLVVNLAVGLALIAGVAVHVTLIDYYHTLNIQVYTWRPLESYYRQGFLPSFISGAQTIRPPRPDDYTVEGAEETIEEYATAYDEGAGSSESRAAAEAQFSEEQPTVIAIMNETFSDLSIYQQLHAGYTGPEYFKGMSDCLSRGKLYVSAYGGGTANTEYEFLTGNSMANLGSGVYPYTIYNLQDTENLAAQFKDLGYDTVAMHPNHATNWNRENVYEDFGFDQFLSIEDFQDAETLRGMVTDQATYDKILELLDTNSNPQFIFDVTMQNHGGYDAGTVPEDQLSSWAPAGVADENLLAQLNVYLTCAEASDRDLASFIEDLRALDRPVVLVFFGDHQPSVSSALNDALYPGEDPQAHQWRIYRSSYLVWANYDVAGNPQASATEEIGAAGLAAQVLHLIGAPLTDYQKALVASRAEIPALSAMGYRGADGVAYALDAEGPYRSLVDDLRTIQYLHFARRVR